MEKMRGKSKKILMIGVLVLFLVSALTMTVFASGEEAASTSNMYATFWSLLPPVIAIVLALITKEVYSSLFIGILAGGLFYANFSPTGTIVAVTEVLTEKIADGWNAGILIFLVALGIMVSLMNKAGGSSAFGRWASHRIKTKRGALLSTFALGCIIFIDDYFNCLTVGSVMMPVTDKHKISRAKLAYIIDATAAPICIIAPISSWAAAVTSSATGDIDGFGMFLASIPYNLYALLTIVMIILITALGLDYGPMKRHERMAMEEGDLFGGTGNEYAVTETQGNSKGKLIDLILPVVVLMASCIVGMIYTGGFFEGESFRVAFENSDASAGLALGSIIAILFTFILYVPRKILSFKDFASCLPDGFRQMVPAILILSMAWTISGLCNDRLGAGEFVGSIVSGSATASALLPAILFLIALGLAFATGTSWGTFGILIPIAMAIFPEMSEILVISISAILAGAVCGDHISPISDTTIMASTGAQSNHIVHVSTQIPYALLVAGISFIGFILAGFVRNWIAPLALGLVLLVAVLLVIRYQTQRSDPLSDAVIVKMPNPKEADKSSK
jgi:Na+/H+ antiporter NhaC